MKRTLISNAIIVNEGSRTAGSVGIEGGKITEILSGNDKTPYTYDETIDAGGGYLLPGVIDEHVHFRDPGLTHKADIYTESRAAAAGGVTSIMDMPNTNPQTTTSEDFYDKLDLMASKSLVNYSCYFGATNDNYRFFHLLNGHRVCGIKLFMGASTGNMLVDNTKSLRNIFNSTDLLIAAHCENQDIIQKNTAKYKAERGNSEDLPLSLHPYIRSEEACYRSSELAVRLAEESGARLHILHISTARELELFNTHPLKDKKITAEACVPHLLFSSLGYEVYGTRIKCNPAIKRESDRLAILAAVNNGRIDTIATDHAPHLLSEKQGGALKAASGMPMIQFALVSMLELVDKEVFTMEKIVEKMCHAPADLYRIGNRGYIREGYQADLVLVKPGREQVIDAGRIYSKCGWSPLEGQAVRWQVEKTFVNGNLVYNNGLVDESHRGQELRFG